MAIWFLFRVACMYNDHVNKKIVKDPRGSLETLPANLHATPYPDDPKIPSLNSGMSWEQPKSSYLKFLILSLFLAFLHTDMLLVALVFPFLFLQSWQKSSDPFPEDSLLFPGRLLLF